MTPYGKLHRVQMTLGAKSTGKVYLHYQSGLIPHKTKLDEFYEPNVALFGLNSKGKMRLRSYIPLNLKVIRNIFFYIMHAAMS